MSSGLSVRPCEAAGFSRSRGRSGLDRPAVRAQLSAGRGDCAGRSAALGPLHRAARPRFAPASPRPSARVPLPWLRRLPAWPSGLRKCDRGAGGRGSCFSDGQPVSTLRDFVGIRARRPAREAAGVGADLDTPRLAMV